MFPELLSTAHQVIRHPRHLLVVADNTRVRGVTLTNKNKYKRPRKVFLKEICKVYVIDIENISGMQLSLHCDGRSKQTGFLKRNVMGLNADISLNYSIKNTTQYHALSVRYWCLSWPLVYHPEAQAVPFSPGRELSFILFHPC